MSTFIGLPIQGDINRTSTASKPQKPLSDFSPLVQALLDDPIVDKFGWTGYTPYFNDGDPCVFSAHGLWVKTVEDELDPDDYDAKEDLGVDYGPHPTLGEIHRHYDREARQYVEDSYTGNHEDTLRKAKALDAAIDGGHFNDVLLTAFGDHVEVTVTRTGIELETYDHD